MIRGIELRQEVIARMRHCPGELRGEAVVSEITGPRLPSGADAKVCWFFPAEACESGAQTRERASRRIISGRLFAARRAQSEDRDGMARRG